MLINIFSIKDHTENTDNVFVNIFNKICANFALVGTDNCTQKNFVFVYVSRTQTQTHTQNTIKTVLKKKQKNSNIIIFKSDLRKIINF